MADTNSSPDLATAVSVLLAIIGFAAGFVALLALTDWRYALAALAVVALWFSYVASTKVSPK